MKELLAKRAAAVAKLNDARAKFMTAISVDSPTAEQAADAKKLEGEVVSLESSLANIDRQINTQKQIDADALIQQRTEAEAEAARIQGERDKRLLDSKGGRISAWDSVGKVPAEVKSDDPNRGFRNSSEFLTAVISVSKGGLMDNRLAPLMAAGSDEARTNSDPAGGFLIPRGFAPNMLQIMPEDDPIGQLTTRIPMETPVLDIPARVDKDHTTSVSGGLTVTRRPETVAGTPGQMSFEQVSLNAKCLFGLTYASEEILRRSPMSFISILEKGFSDQFAAHLLNERLNGTGVGEYLGACHANNPCLVSVSKESGQAAATIVKENIDKMRSRCWGYGKAVWLANHDCLPALRSLAMVVGIGGAPVPYFTIDAAGNAMLDGRPIHFTEFTQTIGTVGDLVLGNWSEYLEGILTPNIQQAESIHVRFVNHERAFKFWVENCGMPWWKAPLTPKRSSQTLSPFVVLATRA